ncbi:TBC1 domain family member 14 [Phyllostomus discolor]|uniref:TBC1 domain family member 14 n=1 Tax=Phyllostomus discolor TaxID=89673 RepID=A0A834EXI4_9CHIR|nr:TBC1 domain family member 14 [Phyllostomus discolor]
MTDGSLSSPTNGVALMGILDGPPGTHIQSLQCANLKAPSPLSPTELGPRPSPGAPDQRSLQSADSGIPTLEIGDPEPVACGVARVRRRQPEAETAPERACQSACPLPSCAPPAPAGAERGPGVRKSSTFPRTGYDSVKPHSPAARALSRSDDVSVGSVSSLSTELSATLSVSNEDILDLVVTSSSSAIVTLENDDDDPQFADVALSSAGGSRDRPRQDRADGAAEGSKLKLLGPFGHFFSRNLLARKQNARLDRHSDLGWKLFGKMPLRENAQKEPKRMQKEYEDKAGAPRKPPSPKQNVRKNLDFEPLSTTALILEDRPANLPAKPAEEAQKHRQQYEEMVVQAKKRELKEARRRKKQLEERCRLEESIGNAALTWNNEVLPHWETVWSSRKVRDLWWQGIPPSVRGKVWSLAIGNELNITHELFDICLARAKERWRSFSAGGPEAESEDAGFPAADREASLELIKLDISRTFPNLCIFQQMLTYFAAFEVFFEENLPKLFAHFKKNNLTPDIYLIDWIFTLYSKSLPLDLACRVWDVFCRDGEEFLFRTALGLLKLFEDILTKMDFIHVAQFLTRLPDHLPAEELFASIATIQMQSRNRKWAQVLTALQRDSRDVERGSPSLRH